MKLTQEEKSFLHHMHVLTGNKISDLKSMFENMAIIASYSYSEGEDIVIPFLGKLHIDYKEDEVTDKGRKAIVNCDFNLSDNFNLIIGQIVDGSETETEKVLMNRIQKKLEKFSE